MANGHPPDDPPPVPPVWPDDGACCGNGCDPCVFDLYAIEDERYRLALAAWDRRQAARAARAAAEPGSAAVR